MSDFRVLCCNITRSIFYKIRRIVCVRISISILPNLLKTWVFMFSWLWLYYYPIGRRNHGRPLKRLLDTWDRNGSTSDPTPWKIYGDDGCDCKGGTYFEDATHYSLQGMCQNLHSRKTWRYRQNISSKGLYICTRLRGISSQNKVKIS